jgi:acyl-CoA dehydrogenase
MRDSTPDLTELFEVAAAHAGHVDVAARFPDETVTALRKSRLLAAYVPAEFGGLGMPLQSVARVCHDLGRRCASSAMVFAMHQIQVACIVHHGRGAAHWNRLLQRIAGEQLLIASVTSEAGVGGDIRSSRCAVREGSRGLEAEKEATTLSYGEHADAYLLTARRSPDAPSSDQVLVWFERQQCTLVPRGVWNPMGMRGTCSPPFTVAASFTGSDVLPQEFAVICAETMAPVSHLLWGSLWLGIAADALARAQKFLRMRSGAAGSGSTAAAEHRLASAAAELALGSGHLTDTLREYVRLHSEGEAGRRELSAFAFAIRVNALKTSLSELIVSVISRCLTITGFAGYQNDSPVSVSRHLRDAYSAQIMIANERLLATNGTLLLAQRGN